MENLKGTITEIVYYNNENGYFVGILENKELQTTVVGYLPAVEKGGTYSLFGMWKEHHNYGEQFAFTEYASAKPETREAIIAYLGSGAIKGIGPKLATNIVEKFGEDTFNILDNEIERLTEMPGIGPKKLESIKTSYEERRAFLSISMYFQDHGIKAAYAMRLYKRYGENTIEIINDNPYRLISEIPGLGFQKVDAIADKLGIDRESDKRISQGILYFMRKFTAEGNTFVPEKYLKEKAAQWLEVPIELIEDNLTGLIISGMLSIEIIEERKGVFLTQYNEAEKRVCKNIFDLIEVSIEETGGNIEAVIKQVESETGIFLVREQKEAVKTALTENICVITGGPGTGKTTIINTIIRAFKNAGKSVAIAAPTGRAAKRITQTSGEEAFTIHRLLEYYYSELRDEMVFGKNREDKLDYDIVIIDEASMVDLMLMDALLDALEKGTRLIIVGDVDQLPPVGAGSVLKDILESEIVPTVRLKEIFRQAGESLIIVNAHRINKGEYPYYNEKGKDFFLIRKENEKDIVGTVMDLCGSRLPGYKKDCVAIRDIQVLTPGKKGIAGSINLNKELQRLFNPPENQTLEKSFGDRVFREGDKVMQIKNNYRMEWRNINTFEEGEGIFNGDVGYIKKIDMENNSMGIIFDEQKYVNYEFSDLEQLDLAYAVTVHKSQGSEFPIIVMPIGNIPPMLGTRNLLYTGVTRGKDIVVLVGGEGKVKSMIDNNYVNKKYSGLAYRLRERAMVSMGGI